MSKYHQGKFQPLNPQKYKGDPSNIIYRSGWEARVMMDFDKNPAIISWSSEELIINYISPIDGKRHRYFPDFVVEMKDRQGKIKKVIIEVKPDKETRPPMPKTKPTKKYLNEVRTWGVNEAKWEAARAYCNKWGYEFVVITEKHLNKV